MTPPRGNRFNLHHRLAGSIAVAWACTHSAVVSAAVSIDSVTVDGREFIAQPPENNQRALRIPSTARRIEFRFSGAADAPPAPAEGDPATVPPRGTRLRYRLEGMEPNWRDSPASGRVDLSFKDKEKGEVAIADFILAGESANWRGTPEESTFIRQSLEATAPENTVGLGINVLSINSGEAVGVIAIDDVVFTVVRAATGKVERHPLPVDLGAEPFEPFRRPSNWADSGTRVRASQLRMRSLPKPHPILVLVDDEPDRYGGWIARTTADVSPGDRVTLSWSAAWSIGVAREAVAEYFDLKPGTYFFHAGAFFPNGTPTGTEVSLPIEVYVPWHLRRDVWTGAAALSLLGAATAGRAASVRRMRHRLEQIEREHAIERDRARIARDLHDDVGAGLAEIAMQADWVRNEIEGGDSHEAISLTDGIRHSADELVRSIDAIVWAVNPANDSLERFASYVVQSTERFLDAAGLSMRFEIPDPLPPVQLDGTLRHRLFLALREAVHNAVQHGRATSITISLVLKNDRLELAVTDDGGGFDPATAPRDGTHDGLGNMTKQMDEVGGSCDIRSSPGAGTCVRFSVPLSRVASRSNHHA